MKLRIRGNTVRLRLTRGEVELLGESGSVSETTRFAAGGVMEYGLEAVEDLSSCTATFDGEAIRVLAPKAAIAHWVSSDDVAVAQSDAATQDGHALTVLIEKDFACLTERPGEDDRDAYPHPGEC
ncbi:MAG: hypothetical protein RIA65_11570 [Woeseia sp.]